MAGRLALWARRLVGEAISQTQHVLADRDSLMLLLVEGTGGLAGVPADRKSVDGQLVLTDDKGRKVIVPANLVAYVDIAHPDSRRVGFVAG